MATDKLVDFDHVTDYISREAALACFSDWIDRYGHEHTADEMVEYQKIEALPEEDVRPMAHGTWEGETDFIYADLSQRAICDKCGAFAYFYDKMPMNFCPNCGADMREVTP